MTTPSAAVSTGIKAFDKVLSGLRLGDSVVWEVESIRDYALVVEPFVTHAFSQGRNLLYFRFAKHAPLITSEDAVARGIEIVELNPYSGFEIFLDGTHSAIERAGSGVHCVFDNLSVLTADWFSDQMLGNFFQLTHIWLREYEAVSYFALSRATHSFYAMDPITDTTQLLIEVFRRKGKLYVRPLKVEDRDSPQMYMLHSLDGENVRPVTESHTISDVLTSNPRSAIGLPRYQLGVWTRTFIQAESLLEHFRDGKDPPQVVDNTLFQRLLRMALSRDERILGLAERYFSLDDLVAIGRRMLGTGLIGGKSVGMLLSRAILKSSSSRWLDLLEIHDSFYVPSDVFYTFLVRNGCWELRKRQLESSDPLEGHDEVRRRILAGTFQEHMKRRFGDLLDHHGPSPIIVRSSSLLEDNFGNSFAGKYDSVFLANQGSRSERLEQLIDAIKTVYVSTVSKQAISYRDRHGLLKRDEQMGVLIQRVSGAQHGRYYFPQLAGVGYSFNPYVWNEDIDPEAGVLRLVFGLGTRAVDRSDDDYTRLVALNAPKLSPEAESSDVRRYSQHNVDTLDMEQNRLATKLFTDLADENIHDIPMHLFSSSDRDSVRMAREQGLPVSSACAIRFEELFSKTEFVSDMRELLATLRQAYEYPVEIEFTANFNPDGSYKINLVQCRPFQIKGGINLVEPPPKVSEEAMLLKTSGPVIGRSRLDTVDRIIYVVPSVYGRLTVNARHAVAQTIGQLNECTNENSKERTTMLLGPGRWGTSTPTLGVPVSFAQINRVSILCEIVAMRDDLVPDVSFGTHFFSELVEMDMLYLALFPGQEKNFLNLQLIEQCPNKLTELLPGAARQEEVIRVIDPADCFAGRRVKLRANVLKQDVLCYLDP